VVKVMAEMCSSLSLVPPDCFVSVLISSVHSLVTVINFQYMRVRVRVRVCVCVCVVLILQLAKASTTNC
jgi:hypothetical protein